MLELFESSGCKTRLRIPHVVPLVMLTVAQLVLPLFVSASIDDDDETASDGRPYVSFKVALKADVDGMFVLDGDEVECVLQNDLKVYDETLAPKGSKVIAHVEEPNKAAVKEMKQENGFSLRRPLVLRFDKVITPSKKELIIDGLPIRQNSIFNNGGTFRLIKTGAHGELLKAQDVDVVQIPEAGFAIPKQFVDRKNMFYISLKEGDEIKVEGTLEPTTNASGKILNRAQ